MTQTELLKAALKAKRTLTPQELEIAKAAYCVGTMWDEYEGKEDFGYMVGLRLDHLIKLVMENKKTNEKEKEK